MRIWIRPEAHIAYLQQKQNPKTKSSSLKHISLFLIFLKIPLFTYYTLIYLKLLFSMFSLYNLFHKSLLLYSLWYFLFFLKFNLFYTSRSFPTFNTLKSRNAVNLSLSANPHPPQLHWLQTLPPQKLVLIFWAYLYQFVSSPGSFLLTDVTVASSSQHHLQQHSRLLRLKIEQETIWDSEITLFPKYFTLKFHQNDMESIARKGQK